MVAQRDVMPALKNLRARVGGWLEADEYAVPKLVVGLSLFALVFRLVFLGHRVAHFDEGRVAYWALHFGETGSFAYRYIIHGPFIQHVDRWVFALLGANDFTMRLPIAIVGSLLPLTALLFREHLRREETIALALLFAINPALLFYSRFMRSDILVAVFMFTAFGLLVRFYDTRKPRYLYGIAFFIALGFASKENALVYILTWLGAMGLLLAKVLLLPNGFVDAINFVSRTPSGPEIRDRIIGRVRADVDLVVGTWRSFRDRHDTPYSLLGAYLGHIIFALTLFGFVSLFFYAPRGAGVEGIQHPPAPPTEGSVGFWQGMTNPAIFSDMFQATTDRVADQFGEWLNPASEKTVDEYRRHLGVFVKVLAFTAAPLTAFSVFGYVVDRLGYVRPRHLIPFAAYGGFVSIFGYPYGTDIGAPWIATHAIVPLAVPAAVGLAAVFRWGLAALDAEDVVGVAISALIFLLIAALVANVAVTRVYTNGHVDGNALVQFAQPDQSVRDSLEEIDRIATANTNGTDVVVYHGESGDAYDKGEAFVEESREEWDDAWWNLRPTCLQWHNTLPLPWYFAAGEMDVACENQATALGVRAMENQPPIIITQEYDSTVPRDRLRAQGYEGTTHRLRTSGARNLFTVWIHESAR